MTSRTLLALLLLIAPFVAGCLNQEDADARVNGAPTPRVGDSFEYQGTDGSRLVVTVEPGQIIQSPFGPVASDLVLNFTLTPVKRPDMAVTNLEHVAMPGGTIIRQDLYCFFPRRLAAEADDPDNRENCRDPLVRTMFGPHGLPGGIGVGPLWGSEGAVTRETVLTTRSPFVGDVTIRYAPPETLAGGACRGHEIQTTTPEAIPADWMTFTLHTGRFVLCPGAALPHEFAFTFPQHNALSEVEFPKYALVGQQRGGGNFGPSGPPPHTDSLSDACWEGGNRRPEPMIDNETPHLGLTSYEAAVAARADPQVAAWLDEHDQAPVVHADRVAGAAGWILGGTYRYWEETWKLTFADQAGAALMVEVRKRFEETDAGVAIDPSVRIEEVTETAWAGASPARLFAAPHFPLRKALDKGDEVFTTLPFFIMLDPSVAQGPALSDPQALDTRYKIRIYYTQTHDELTENGSFVATRIWRTTFDSLTGCPTEVVIDEAGLRQWDRGDGPYSPPELG